MRLVAKRGVLQAEHQNARALADWDNARVFLEVVRSGSFRSAAEKLGQSINAVRRQVDEFEREIGAVLFTRDVHGTRITNEGLQVVEAAERMEAATFDLLRSRNLISPAISGEVRVAVTEGLGTFWLAPRLVEFQQMFPSIAVDLHCAMHSADVLRHEADVAVQLKEPTSLDMKVVKLGRLHVMWYASQKYIELYGMPATYDELIKHRIVMQFADQTAADDIRRMVPWHAPGRFAGHAQQRQQRKFLGDRQRRRHRPASHICFCTRQRSHSAGHRRHAPRVRHLSDLSS
jgi:DNA-binding transcriptional LysR family regulator